MAREKISILFPGQDRVEYRFIPEETWHDLGFDSITEKVAKKNGEAALIQRVMTGLTDDPEVSRFRAGVFDDILRNPAIRDRLVKLLDQVKMFYDYGVVNRHAGDEAGDPRSRPTSRAVAGGSGPAASLRRMMTRTNTPMKSTKP